MRKGGAPPYPPIQPQLEIDPTSHQVFKLRWEPGEGNQIRTPEVKAWRDDIVAVANRGVQAREGNPTTPTKSHQSILVIGGHTTAQEGTRPNASLDLVPIPQETTGRDPQTPNHH